MRKLVYVAKFNGTIEDNLKAYGFSTRICSLLKRELGLVTIEGEPKFVVDKANAGDKIKIILRENNVTHIEPYNFPINIIFEDDDVAIVEKPPNIAVISTSAHYNQSLMNALAAIWGDFVYHPVTRLDKGTSGLMLIAKHSLSHSLLNMDLAHETDGNSIGKSVLREYFCLVSGCLDDKGVINAPIAHIDKTNYRRTVNYGCGKRAVTEYEVLDRFGKYSLVRVKLLTGRTHQIRVHMSYMGNPLVGDELYGGDISLLNRPALHSYHLEFYHPISGEYMQFNSDLPDDIKAVLRRIE